jgi:hypothetical protein
MENRFPWVTTDAKVMVEAEEYFRKEFDKEPVGKDAKERYGYIVETLARAGFGGIFDLPVSQRQDWLRQQTFR